MILSGRFEGLWRHVDFVRLWSAQTISMFGTQVSRLAIPLIAVLTLDATALEVGIVAAVETLPYPVFGLFAGVFADRLRRRPMLIAADLARAVLFCVLPLAWWLDGLSLALLGLVAFLAGTCSVFSDIAAQSYLPVLVGRERLIEANSKFALSSAGSRLLGPGLAGGLIELLSAPLAVAADALSFLISGLLIGRIRAPEPAPQGQVKTTVVDDIRGGIRYVSRHPLLRPIAACTATFNVFVGVFAALLVLFVTSDLDVSPGLLGIVFASGGVGVLLGARLVARVTAHLGVGRALVAGILVSSLGSLAVALAPGSLLFAFLLLAAGRVVYSAGTVLYDITQVSLRQAITPDAMLGRMNATIRVVVWGALPVGSLLGGLLGEYIGLRPTLLFATVGGALSVLWIVFSEVSRLESYSDIEDTAG